MNTSLSSSINFGVKVGGKELIFSAIVHLDRNECEIEIDKLKLVFCFKSDGGEKRYSGRTEEGKLTIDLFNHDNALGEGVFSPLEFGHLNGRKLFITYCVSTVAIEENKRRLELAFYLGDVV